jgi:hypothetical protein
MPSTGRPSDTTLRVMTQTDKTVRCVECLRTIREGEAKAAGWFYWTDGENRHLVCSLCASADRR